MASGYRVLTRRPEGPPPGRGDGALLDFMNGSRHNSRMSRAILDPSTIDFIALCRQHPVFVPLIFNGEVAPVRDVEVSLYPPLMPMNVKDYVLGLRALGYHLDLIEQHSRLKIEPPSQAIPPTWESRAQEIKEAFGEGREDEVVAYLLSRMIYD